MPNARAKLARERSKRLARLDHRGWALVLPGSIVAFVLAAALTQHLSAEVLTYLALVGVPIGAALALGLLAHGSRAMLALAVAPLFALASIWHGSLVGQAAAVVLTSLSCVALGSLLAAVTPSRWIALGIVAMSLVDVGLVAGELLQHPNNVLIATHPLAGLPRLQAAVFGSAVMGYGDLFVAGVLGGLLAKTGSKRRQASVALLVVALSCAYDALFFFVNDLAATVPVAVALLLVLYIERVRSRSRALRDPARSPGLSLRATLDRRE